MPSPPPLVHAKPGIRSAVVIRMRPRIEEPEHELPRSCSVECYATGGWRVTPAGTCPRREWRVSWRCWRTGRMADARNGTPEFSQIAVHPPSTPFQLQRRSHLRRLHRLRPRFQARRNYARRHHQYRPPSTAPDDNPARSISRLRGPGKGCHRVIVVGFPPGSRSRMLSSWFTRSLSGACTTA